LGRLRHNMHTGVCATSCPSHTEYPPDHQIPTQDVGKFEYHALKVLTIKDNLFDQLIGAHLWLDNAPVTILSTVHDIHSQQELLRAQPGRKSTNVTKAREAFGNVQEKEMMIPLRIDHYNDNMGGIDIVDPMCSYYDTQLTSFRTWWPMLFWAYDSMVTNAYFIYRDIPQSSNTITHNGFELQCAWGLLVTGSGPISTSQIVHSARSKFTWSNVEEGTSLPIDRSCDCGHLPVHRKEGKQSGYWLCH